MSRVVIIGAGWAGQGVCEALAGAPETASIVCIDKGVVLEIGATWQFELEGRGTSVSVPLADSVAAPYLRRGDVTSVDYAGKKVALADGGVVEYDYLVLACGAVSDASSIPGLGEHAVDLSAKGFAGPMEAFLESLGGGGKKTALVSVTKCPYKCPPLPFEIAMLLDAAARRRGVREGLDIVVTYPVPWPFGGPKAKKAFTDAMTRKGIEFRPDTALKSLSRSDDGTTRVATASTAGGDSGVVDADLVLAVYPHRAPDFVDASLLNQKGSVPVDFRSNAVPNVDGVFCVGDACAAVLPSVGAPIPKAGEFAYKAGKAVGEALLATLKAEPMQLPTERFAKCVAEAGDGAGIVVGPDFSAAFKDPDNGKPVFTIEPSVGGTTDKVAWIQRFLDTFAAPGKAPTFAPKKQAK